MSYMTISFTKQIDVLVDWTSIITAVVIVEATSVPLRWSAQLCNLSENANAGFHAADWNSKFKCGLTAASTLNCATVSCGSGSV